MKPSKASDDRLRSMIRSAFRDIECPAAEGVVAWNRVEIDEEAENVRVHLVGRRWQDVSPHDLRFGEDRFLLTTDA